MFVLFGLLVAGESFARFGLDLGTPPLSVADPQIEYMFKPDQDVYRFGNHIIINHYGMRTKPFPDQHQAGEIRIMVFGDSVLNGGNLTDHEDLATTILRDKVETATEKNVIVGNISAGSWGPGNWLAYAKKFRFFGADIIVLVVSSHDYADNPTFEPLNPNTHPTHRPVSALLEGAVRYLPRYMPSFSSPGDSNDPTAFTDPPSAAKQQGLADLAEFLELAKKNTRHVLVFQHWEREEVERGVANAGNIAIQDLCAKIGISTVQLQPYFKQAIKNGENPYRDNIHPNQIGQRLIGQAIFDQISDNNLLTSRSNVLSSTN